MSTTTTPCALCRAIPFDRLPTEEQPALPHHSSLQALVVSGAQGCPLCVLIVLAVGDICAAIKNARDGNKDASPGGWIAYSSATLPSGKSCQLTTEGGNYLKGSSSIGGSDGVDYNGPMYYNPLELFKPDAALRPWLFGNWWKHENPDLPPQLIAMGVRISKTPNLEDAAGNSSERVQLRGTLMRIRARPGRSHLFTRAPRIELH